MLTDVYHALERFRSAFARQRSWLLFCAVVLSFLAAPEMIGVTSMCRFWQGNEAGFCCVFLRSAQPAFQQAQLGGQRIELVRRRQSVPVG